MKELAKILERIDGFRGEEEREIINCLNHAKEKLHDLNEIGLAFDVAEGVDHILFLSGVVDDLLDHIKNSEYD